MVRVRALVDSSHFFISFRFIEFRANAERHGVLVDRLFAYRNASQEHIKYNAAGRKGRISRQGHLEECQKSVRDNSDSALNDEESIPFRR